MNEPFRSRDREALSKEFPVRIVNRHWHHNRDSKSLFDMRTTDDTRNRLQCHHQTTTVLSPMFVLCDSALKNLRYVVNLDPARALAHLDINLTNPNTAIECDSAGLHYDVIINRFTAVDQIFDLLN